MSSVREAIAAHHRELTESLSQQAARLEQGSGQGAGDADGLVAFLKTELLPHAAGEEHYLYPVMDDLIRQHGSATATMRIDHQYIEETSRQIEEQARALRGASSEAERAAARLGLARLAGRLDAILRLHVEKEERAYLPLFEQYLPAEEQRRLLNEMHESADAHNADETDEEATPAADGDAELDVRPLPPARRHELIFRTFDALPGGAAFVLINDHDPKPLYYQLNAERAGQLVWEYLEEGPSAWRVRIGRVA